MPAFEPWAAPDKYWNWPLYQLSHKHPQLNGEAITQYTESRNKKYTTSLLCPWDEV